MGVFPNYVTFFFSRFWSQTAAVCARQRLCNNRFVYVIRALSQLSAGGKLKTACVQCKGGKRSVFSVLF